MPHWVFGYGSIINNESRASSTSDDGACFVRLTAGYVREWSFRSCTGFTALGVREVGPSEARAIAGVLVAVDSDNGLAALDAREVGYRCDPTLVAALLPCTRG
jgi:cation transport regulator ChaC